MTRFRTVALAASSTILLPPMLVAALSRSAQAQQLDAFTLDPIIVSGSLSPVAQGHTGATVEVLDGREAETSDTDLATRLGRLPGLGGASNGGLGANSSIQIRGLPARYVAVRIDGIDVSDPSGTQNQFSFGGLTGAGLGRIEVLKGSQSALYGSEAIGGLVDITTWRPSRDGLSGSARAEAGSYDTYSENVNLGWRDDKGQVALTLGRIDSNGFSAKSGNGEDDGFKQTMATLYADRSLSDVLSVGGALIFRDSSVGIDPTNVQTAGHNNTRETGARTFAKLTTGAVRHTLSYSYFNTDRHDTSPGAFTPFFNGQRQAASYLGSADLGASSTLNVGLDYTHQKATAGASLGSQNNTAVKAEWLVAPTDTVDLSFALRHDDDSEFGGKTTGRIAGVWRPAQGWALRAVAGTGFRAPSLFERFSAFGDPTLQPEDSSSYELGVERDFAGGKVQATLFHIEVDNLIQFDPAAISCGSGFGCYNQVPGKTRSDGVELSGRYDLSAAVTVFANYTYTRARNNGQQLTRTPRHDAVIGLDADLSHKLHGTVDLRHVADVKASAFAPAGNKVGNYTLVGAGLSYKVSDGAEVYLRLENLLDQNYETAGGFNTPGRSAYAGVRATF